MQQSTPIILLTRPQRQSAEFAMHFHGVAHVVVSPVIEIKKFPVKVFLPENGVFIFASQNGILAVDETLDLRGRACYTVGLRTAEIAVQAGLKVLGTGENAATSIDMILRDRPTDPLIFVRGQHTTEDMAKTLKNGGLDTLSVIAYAQKPIALSVEAVELLVQEATVICPLFSIRSAQILAAECRRVGSRATIKLIAISDAVLAAWDGPAPSFSEVAVDPTSEAIANKILRLMRRSP